MSNWGFGANNYQATRARPHSTTTLLLLESPLNLKRAERIMVYRLLITENIGRKWKQAIGNLPIDLGEMDVVAQCIARHGDFVSKMGEGRYIDEIRQF